MALLNEITLIQKPPERFRDMYVISPRARNAHCYLFKEPFQKEARKVIWELKKNVDFAIGGYAHSYFIITRDPALSRVLAHTTCRLILSRERHAKSIQSFFRSIRPVIALRKFSTVSKKCNHFYSHAPLDVLGEVKSFW